jgi:uncharacterized protein YfiM (DUF2279 family)
LLSEGILAVGGVGFAVVFSLFLLSQRIVAVARDSRCRKDCRCRLGFSLSLGIVAVAWGSRCRLGLSLSLGVLAVAWDCRCRKGGILRGILAVLAVVGILAVVRAYGILAVGRD